MERSEEDKILQAPLKVILGGKEYSIAPLVIKESREWKKKVIKLIAPLPKLAKTALDSPESFEQALTTTLISMPEEVTELFFEYAKKLDRDEIESTTNDYELSKAFQEVIAFAFPLAESAPDILARLMKKPQ